VLKPFNVTTFAILHAQNELDAKEGKGLSRMPPYTHCILTL